MADENDDKQEPDAGRETQVGQPVVDEAKTEVFFSREQESGGSVAASEATPAAPEPAAPEPAAPTPEPQPAAAPPSGSSGTSPAAADRAAADSHDQFEQKPEYFIAGAFVGAFVLGKILKKLTGSDD